MAGEIFGSVVEPSITVGTKKWYAVPLSVLAHAVGLAALAVVPLVAAGLLPTPESVLVFAAAPAAPPLPPPPALAHAPIATSVVLPNRDAAPLEAPAQITAEPAPQGLLPIRGVSEGIPAGLPAGGLRLAAPPDTPPPAFVRPGGAIKEPRKIHDVTPAYPAIAIAAKAEGMVIIDATISKEGDVVDATVLRSQPLLDQAALDAVRQWKFTPTTLNGVPVEVRMTVTVNFRLH
jgi:protein TonB